MTNVDLVSAKRRYFDACGTAHALELVGDRWALLVMRELMFGPRRFADLRASLPGISANVLTQRLGDLVAAGIATRRRLPPPAAVWVYELTAWGAEADAAIMALGRWAARSPGHDPSLPLSAASLMLSFRTMFAPERAAGLAATIGFDLGGDAFTARLAEGLTIERVAAARGDAVFAGGAVAVAAAVYGGVALAALEAQGQLAITGDRALAARFVTLFPLPPKADAAPASG